MESKDGGSDPALVLSGHVTWPSQGRPCASFHGYWLFSLDCGKAGVEGGSRGWWGVGGGENKSNASRDTKAQGDLTPCSRSDSRASRLDRHGLSKTAQDDLVPCEAWQLHFFLSLSLFQLLTHASGCRDVSLFPSLFFVLRICVCPSSPPHRWLPSCLLLHIYLSVSFSLSLSLPPLFRYDQFAQGPCEQQGRPAGHEPQENFPQPLGYFQVQVPGPSLPAAVPAPGRQRPGAGPRGGSLVSATHSCQHGLTAWVPEEGGLQILLAGEQGHLPRGGSAVPGAERKPQLGGPGPEKQCHS